MNTPPRALDFSQVSLDGYRTELETEIRAAVLEGTSSQCSDNASRFHAEGLCIAVEVRGETWVIRDLSPACPSGRGCPGARG